MKTKKLLSSLLAGLVPALAVSARAAEPLTTSEMSAVRGSDGSIALAATDPKEERDSLAATLASVFMNPRDATQLDAARFSAALAAAGWPAAAMPGYEGQPVTQYKVDAPPITFSFDASELLHASTGLTYGGPSMGTFTVSDCYARGTTVWTWVHH